MSESMNVKTEQISESRVKLTIEVTAADFDIALDRAFEKVVKEVKADGFRPGKMPKSIFINRYGWNTLYSDALEFAFQETYPKAAMEAGIYPVADPKVDLDFASLEKGKSFSYTAEVDIWPPVHLGEYKGIKVKPLSKRVLKKDIDAYVKKVLKDKVENVIKDTPAENGDTVVIDFEGFVDDVAFEGGKAENYPLELGSNSFIPGFEEQLVGVKTDEERAVQVTFPKDYHESLAGKVAVFKIKVHEVKSKVYPELDDALVEELAIADVHHKEAYLDYVKATLTKEKATEAENHLVNTLMDKVCANAKADIPQSLIDSEVANQVERVEQQAKQYGLPVEALLQYSGVESMDAFKKNAEQYSKKMLMQELVIEEIIKLENLIATEAEIETEYQQLAGVTVEDTEEQKQAKIADIQKKYRSSQVAYKISSEKVLAFLKENADLK